MFKYLIIIAVIVLAWCPWLTSDEALSLVDAKIAEVRVSTPDLCAISIDKSSIRKVPFGYTEQVSYNCATSDSTYGVLQSTNIVFVTFFKHLWGIPHQTINKNP